VRVLLTGAAGYCGIAGVRVLGREHWLRCTTHHTKMEPIENGEVVNLDLATYADCEAAVKDVDAVVHMAIAGGQREEYKDPELPMKWSVVGTANLLEAARRAGINRFVLMSSGAVVTGYSRDTYIHAAIPHYFKGLYCLTKSLQERIAEQYAEEYGMVIPCLRPWSVVDGPTGTVKWGGGKIEPQKAESHFGLICRHDLAEACRLALTAPLQGFQALNIFGSPAARRWFDVERTEKLLGWKPKYDFADSMLPEEASK
jgi:nucleoside-diphosphate-sugar epimerase